MSSRTPRYVEPDPAAPEYAGTARKSCSVCGRILPVHPDFYHTHTVIGKNGRDRYHYRRPECRSCRNAAKREYTARIREANEYIDSEGKA